MRITKLNKPSERQLRIALASLLVLFAVFSRLLPHPANFTPLAAVAIFGGVILPRRWALTLPLAAMIISDLIIGMHSLVLLTWGSFALIASFSSTFLKNIRPTNLALTSFGASALFYLVTNFGVWLEGRMYTLNWEGLISCYYNALPFFRNTLAGDMVYTGLIFGVYALTVKLTMPTAHALVFSKPRS